MAPTRPRHKKTKGKPSAVSSKKRSEVKQPSTRQLLAAAEASLGEGDLSAALNTARRALDDADRSSPYQGAIHTLLGQILLEHGEVDEARSHLLQAVKADSDGTKPEEQGGGADKFLYLAQVSEDGGRDSVAWFERGAGALRAQIAALEARSEACHSKVEKAQVDAEAELRKRKLAEVLCAVAEVYMTDLSFQDDAEAQCEKMITEATMLADKCADVWQTVASVRVSQNKEQEAKAALDRSLGLWEGLPPEDERVPEYSVRVSLVRLLMTVGSLDTAVDVAARLIMEDDQAVQVWYLGGYALQLTGEALQASGEAEIWKEYWIRSRRWLGKCLKLYDQLEYDDERLHEHAKDLLASLVAAIGEAPDDDEDDDEEWEDDSDDDDDDYDDDQVEGEDDDDDDDATSVDAMQT